MLIRVRGGETGIKEYLEEGRKDGRDYRRAELDERVDAFAKKIGGGAMKSIKYTKTAINVGLKQLAHTMMDTCMAYEALTNRSQDHLEAINAFSQKRKPKFTGL